MISYFAKTFAYLDDAKLNNLAALIQKRYFISLHISVLLKDVLPRIQDNKLNAH